MLLLYHYHQQKKGQENFFDHAYWKKLHWSHKSLKEQPLDTGKYMLCLFGFRIGRKLWSPIQETNWMKLKAIISPVAWALIPRCRWESLPSYQVYNSQRKWSSPNVWAPLIDFEFTCIAGWDKINECKCPIHLKQAQPSHPKWHNY